MKFMKLGSKPDSFQTDGDNIRYVATELATDAVINVGDVKFYLHKFPLLSKSARLQKLVALSNDENHDEICIDDIPGGPAAFEVCAKFCYGMTVTLNAYNVVATRCAAEYLEMYETVEKGNLVYKIDVFLNSSIFRSWKDSIIVLQTTKSLLPWTEELKVVSHCLDSIASKASVDTSRVEWSYTYNRKKLPTENGNDPQWNGVRKQPMVPKDWWVEDLCDLQIDLYKRVITTIKTKGHLHHTKTLKNPRNPYLLIMADNLYSVDLDATNPAATKITLPTAEQLLENQLHVVNSCNGLVLVSLQYSAELFLLNPSTRECKKLPVLPFALYSAYRFPEKLFGVGYDSSTDDYKVVRISARSSKSGTSIMAVYSLRTDSWRRIQDVDFRLVPCTDTVFVNGCLHGICWRGDRTHRIVAFDLSDEIMRELPTPPFYFAKSYCLSVLGGCLCLVHNRATAFWKMEMYGVRESWMQFRVRTGSFKDLLLCWLGEDEFLLTTTPGRPITQLLVYNSREDAVRNIVVGGVPPEFLFMGAYVESLISPYHGGGIGRQ